MRNWPGCGVKTMCCARSETFKKKPSASSRLRASPRPAHGQPTASPRPGNEQNVHEQDALSLHPRAQRAISKQRDVPCATSPIQCVLRVEKRPASQRARQKQQLAAHIGQLFEESDGRRQPAYSSRFESCGHRVQPQAGRANHERTASRGASAS